MKIKDVLGSIILAVVVGTVGFISGVAAVKTKSLAEVGTFMWFTNLSLPIIVMMLGYHACNFANLIINLSELSAINTIAVMFFLIIEYEIVYLYFLT